MKNIKPFGPTIGKTKISNGFLNKIDYHSGFFNFSASNMILQKFDYAELGEDTFKKYLNLCFKLLFI